MTSLGHSASLWQEGFLLWTRIPPKLSGAAIRPKVLPQGGKHWEAARAKRVIYTRKSKTEGHLTGFHVREMSEQARSIEKESRGRAARSWGVGGTVTAVGMGLILGMMKMYWG